MRFACLRTKVQNYYKKLLPVLRLATLGAHTHHDVQLYDEALGVLLCQIIFDEPEYCTPSYDTSLYDTTLQDAVTMLPIYEPIH
jgi:hypothetical protein